MADIWMDVDAALSEVPVNVLPLLDDTDFKTREESVAYNAAGMDLQWNFVTTAGAYTQTVVTPTTGGDYDWTHQGNGMYSIEIPASGGASINNDAEGFGWFTGVATGVLPWRGPVIGFRAAAINNAMVDGTAVTVVLDETQGAVTFGQVKILANAADEGALHIVNSNADGQGLHAQGVAYGQYNQGDIAGQYNLGEGIPGYGQRNEATGAGGAGQYNLGANGQSNYGTTYGVVAGSPGGDPVSPQWAQAGDAMALTADYDAAKTAAAPGDAMALTADYDAAKTAAQAGDAMTLADDAITADKIATDAIGAAELADDAVTAIQSGLMTSSGYTAPDNAGIAAIGAILTGITSLPKWLRALFRKSAADATALSEINASGGSYDPTTDSNEALRDTAPMGSAMVAAPDNASITAIKGVTDNLAGMLETDGAVKRYTANALEQAPAGAGGGATAEDVRIEMDANSTRLAAIQAQTDLLPSQPADSTDIPTTTDIDTALATAHGAGSWQTGTAAPSASDVAAEVDSVLSDAHGGGAWGAASSAVLYGEAGALSFVYTVYDVGGVTPLAGCEVWVSSDAQGTNRSASHVSDALGRVTFLLDAGPVYVWRQHPSRLFTNPDREVVS